MKKKILSGVFALAFLATAGFGVNKSMSKKTQLSDLALANVEALADGEDGISAKWCYLKQSFTGTNGYKLFCDDRTSDTRIYDCPPESWNNYLESSKDRCINTSEN